MAGKMLRSQRPTPPPSLSESILMGHDLLEAVLQTSVAAITILDKQGNIIFANDRAECVLGLTKADVTQQTYDSPTWQITDFEGQPFPAAQLPFAQIMQTGAPVFDVQHAIQLANQERRFLSINGAPLKNAANEITGAVFAVTDITKRVLTEQALQQSEARYRQMFNANQAIKLLIDIETGAIVDANPAATAFYGYPLETLQQMYLTDLNTSPADEVRERIARTYTQQHFYWISSHRLASGEIREVEVHSSRLDVGSQSLLYSVIHDVTERQRAEAALKESEERFRTVADFTFDWEYWVDPEGNFVYMSPSCERVTGYTREEFLQQPDLCMSLIHPDDRARFLAHYCSHATEPVMTDFRIITRDGTERWLSHACQPVYGSDGHSLGRRVSNRDITDRKRAEAALQAQVSKEQLLEAIAQNIRQSLNLQTILQTTVNEVRQLLQTDRVVILRFSSEYGTGRVVVESCNSTYPPLLGWEIGDSSHLQTWFIMPDPPDQIYAINDIAQANIDPSFVDLLKVFEVKSQLVIPILWKHSGLTKTGNELSGMFPGHPAASSTPPQWGILIAQQCSHVRQWQESEIELLRRLEVQMAVAIQHAELYQQIQLLNVDLESQVHQRTAELQKALGFEAVLRRITERVRDTLDERAILQTVVRELALVLNLHSCRASFYDIPQQTATILYEYTASGHTTTGSKIHINAFPEIYQSLLQRQSLQFCPMLMSPAQERVTVFACSVADNQGVLGDLWLIHQSDYTFGKREVQLAQQVAVQCAIAIRQARLFNAAQEQVEELAKLNRLKDDFLSTISHELRTPLSSIKMSIQLLEVLLQRVIPDFEHDQLTPGEAIAKPSISIAQKLNQCLRILNEECDREINLINDLLTLQQLEAGTQPITLAAIKLQDWLPQVIETFEQQAHEHQQILNVHIPTQLPSITTDLFLLNRITVELLTNACKFTPAGETITVTATLVEANPRTTWDSSLLVKPQKLNQISLDQTPPSCQISITNTGIEIPVDQHMLIFNQFYRIPNNDPWKYGGTGLGLNLVKKMVTYVGGAIAVNSHAGQTQFMVTLPLRPHSNHISSASNTLLGGRDGYQ